VLTLLPCLRDDTPLHASENFENFSKTFQSFEKILRFLRAQHVLSSISCFSHHSIARIFPIFQFYQLKIRSRRNFRNLSSKRKISRRQNMGEKMDDNGDSPPRKSSKEKASRSSRKSSPEAESKRDNRAAESSKKTDDEEMQSASSSSSESGSSSSGSSSDSDSSGPYMSPSSDDTIKSDNSRRLRSRAEKKSRHKQLREKYQNLKKEGNLTEARKMKRQLGSQNSMEEGAPKAREAEASASNGSKPKPTTQPKGKPRPRVTAPDSRASATPEPEADVDAIEIDPDVDPEAEPELSIQDKFERSECQPGTDEYVTLLIQERDYEIFKTSSKNRKELKEQKPEASANTLRLKETIRINNMTDHVPYHYEKKPTVGIWRTPKEKYIKKIRRPLHRGYEAKRGDVLACMMVPKTPRPRINIDDRDCDHLQRVQVPYWLRMRMPYNGLEESFAATQIIRDTIKRLQQYREADIGESDVSWPIAISTAVRQTESGNHFYLYVISFSLRSLQQLREQMWSEINGQKERDAPYFPKEPNTPRHAGDGFKGTAPWDLKIGASYKAAMRYGRVSPAAFFGPTGDTQDEFDCAEFESENVYFDNDVYEIANAPRETRYTLSLWREELRRKVIGDQFGVDKEIADKIFPAHFPRSYNVDTMFWDCPMNPTTRCENTSCALQVWEGHELDCPNWIGVVLLEHLVPGGSKLLYTAWETNKHWWELTNLDNMEALFPCQLYTLFMMHPEIKRKYTESNIGKTIYYRCKRLVIAFLGRRTTWIKDRLCEIRYDAAQQANIDAREAYANGVESDLVPIYDNPGCVHAPGVITLNQRNGTNCAYKARLCPQIPVDENAIDEYIRTVNQTVGRGALWCNSDGKFKMYFDGFEHIVGVNESFTDDTTNGLEFELEDQRRYEYLKMIDDMSPFCLSATQINRMEACRNKSYREMMEMLIQCEGRTTKGALKQVLYVNYGERIRAINTYKGLQNRQLKTLRKDLAIKLVDDLKEMRDAVNEALRTVGGAKKFAGSKYGDLLIAARSKNKIPLCTEWQEAAIVDATTIYREAKHHLQEIVTENYNQNQNQTEEQPSTSTQADTTSTSYRSVSQRRPRSMSRHNPPRPAPRPPSPPSVRSFNATRRVLEYERESRAPAEGSKVIKPYSAAKEEYEIEKQQLERRFKRMIEDSYNNYNSANMKRDSEGATPWIRSLYNGWLDQAELRYKQARRKETTVPANDLRNQSYRQNVINQNKNKPPVEAQNQEPQQQQEVEKKKKPLKKVYFNASEEIANGIAPPMEVEQDAMPSPPPRHTPAAEAESAQDTAPMQVEQSASAPQKSESQTSEQSEEAKIQEKLDRIAEKKKRKNKRRRDYRLKLKEELEALKGEKELQKRPSSSSMMDTSDSHGAKRTCSDHASQQSHAGEPSVSQRTEEKPAATRQRHDSEETQQSTLSKYQRELEKTHSSDEIMASVAERMLDMQKQMLLMQQQQMQQTMQQPQQYYHYQPQPQYPQQLIPNVTNNVPPQNWQPPQQAPPQWQDQQPPRFFPEQQMQQATQPQRTQQEEEAQVLQVPAHALITNQTLPAVLNAPLVNPNVRFIAPPQQQQQDPSSYASSSQQQQQGPHFQ
jgi:hypothetical protein